MPRLVNINEVMFNAGPRCFRRHGTLVFGTASTQQKGNSVTGRLKLDLSLSPAGGRPASPGSPPSPSNPFVLHPLLADHSLLKICQAGDAGELSRYVSLLQDRVPARTVNATDASGKVRNHKQFKLL